MSPEKILLGHVWARTQGKRVRKCVCLCTIYDVRFINNVRIAQIFSDH